MTPTVRSWVADRTPLEWLALAAGLACFGAVGWDPSLWEPRAQLALHLVGVGVIVGAGMAAWSRRIEVPRTPLDLPILALVACFALATVSALNVGLSLRALAAIVAFALMLPAALVAIRRHPSWVGAIAGGSVLLLAAPTLVALLARRVEWILAGGPGLPPLRLGGEGTPFGSVAVPPFIIWPAWALAGLIEDRRWRRGVRASLVAVGVPLTILSGSRSAWLAIALTAAVAGVPWLWTRRTALRRRLRPSRGGAVLAIATAVVGVAILAVVIPRLLAVTSLLYRVSLWRDTLAAWGTDPLLGIGPGFMPIARQAAAPDYSFPVRQPHSHNLPLGVLGDAGILGLLAGIALVAVLAWVAGPWRSRTRVGRQAAFVLLGIGIAGLFEDLTFEPNFNLLVIGLVAVALTDAGAVRWTRLPTNGWRRLATGGIAATAGAVLTAAMVSADAAAIAYRIGMDDALAGRWQAASAWFGRAAAIDPWHPAGPKALTVAADAAGDDATAMRAAEDATRLNPGDAHSWTNLAILCEAAGDEDCARSAANRAAATSPFGEPDPYNAARVLERIGPPHDADTAYRHSLRTHRLTAFADAWPRDVDLADAPPGEAVGDLGDLNRVLAGWALDEPIPPAAIDDPAVRALAHAMRGEAEDAAAWMDRAVEVQPDALLTWEIAAVLLADRGHPDAATRAERIGEVVRGGPFTARGAEPAVPAMTWDLATFRAYPGDELVGSAERLFTRPPFPWVLEAVLP
jgi:tetratricopeptide (TPR) repeat protein